MSESRTIDSNGKIEGKKYLLDYSKRDKKEHNLTFHEWISKEKRKNRFEKACNSAFCGSARMVCVASHRRVSKRHAKDLQTMV